MWLASPDIFNAVHFLPTYYDETCYRLLADGFLGKRLEGGTENTGNATRMSPWFRWPLFWGSPLSVALPTRPFGDFLYFFFGVDPALKMVSLLKRPMYIYDTPRQPTDLLPGKEEIS